MGKQKKEKGGLKQADELIEEALAAVEKRERAAKSRRLDDDDLVTISAEVDDAEDTDAETRPVGEAVAKINLKQYIEKESYLRLAADFENFRGRSAKEKLDAERNGKEKILRGFLEILDNLERGFAQVKNDSSPLADGIRIILSQIDSWLRSEGLERIESIGKPFDPTFHDAISTIESDQPAGVVIEELKRGYSWSNRLLRPASVVVSRGKLPSEKPA